ncbi:MAG: hypothetical protein ACMVY4_03555 [Minwuia sp.]|uniref:hypothetical protein n=1 Tax=Minwuia sp. TaxID=2493630 RepID=UPI003A844712
MHYDPIRERHTADYASIAHGMPEYRVLSFGEIDHGIAMARREQARLFAAWMRAAARRIAGLFTSKDSRAVS